MGLLLSLLNVMYKHQLACLYDINEVKVVSSMRKVMGINGSLKCNVIIVLSLTIAAHIIIISDYLLSREKSYIFKYIHHSSMK